MAARALATGALAIVVVACAPSGVVAPSASPTATAYGIRPPEPSASASRTPSPTGILRGARQVPLEAGQTPVNSDGEVLVVTRQLIDGHTTRVEAIELATGNVTPVHEATDASVTAPSIRDGVITLLETRQTGEPMQLEARIFAGRWRAPGTIVQIDAFTFGLAGGDGWSPLPYPQTNGWEIAWMRTTPDGTHEVRLRDAGGEVRTVYASRSPYSFALGRFGDVALADLGATGQSAVVLRLYSGGGIRTLVERSPSDGSGYVTWQLGRIVWPRSFASRFTTAVDRIAPGSLSRETVSAPTGCESYAAVGAELLAWQCAGHVQLEDGTKLGPPTPLLHERAIVFVPSDAQRIATVIPADADDPRPGAGARF